MDLFFPEVESDDNARPARSVCWGSCPSVVDCVQFAVDSGSTHGIFGGLTGQQRYRMTRDGKPIEEAVAAAKAKASGVVPDRVWREERDCERCGARIRSGAWPEDRNGPNASCGNAATYNKGCRCDWCCAAKAILHQRTKKS